jgi:dihydroorotate dehydrogenase (NAD+) catalytic subunit
VGTSTFHDPTAPARVADELAAALAARGIGAVRHAVGLAHENDPAAALAARQELS